jgi:hypothetical protein
VVPCHRELTDEIESGGLVVEPPLSPSRIQGASIDRTLHSVFQRSKLITGTGATTILVSWVVDLLVVGGEAVEDFVCGLVPDVGFWVLVPVGDPGADRCDEVADGAVGAALDPFRG